MKALLMRDERIVKAVAVGSGMAWIFLLLIVLSYGAAVAGQ